MKNFDFDCFVVDVNPLSLQALCRTAVRNILRKNIDQEYPNLKPVPTPKKAPKKKRALRRLVVPLFDTSDDSSDEDNHGRNRSRDMGRVNLNSGDNVDNNNQNREQVSTLIDFVLGRLRDRRNNSTSTTHQCVGTSEGTMDESVQTSDNEKVEAGRSTEQQQQQTSVVEPEESSGCSEQKPDTSEVTVQTEESDSTTNVKAKSETSNKEDFSTMVAWDLAESSNCDKVEEKMEVDSLVENNKNQTANASRSTEVEAVIEHPGEAESDNENSSYGRLSSVDVINGIEEVLVGVLNELRNERGQRDDDGINEEPEENSDGEHQEANVNKASTSVNETEGPKNTKAKTKREKFDSGLGDEIIEKDTISPDTSDLENVMEIDSCSSSDENHDERPTKRGSRPHTEVRTGGKWRRVTLSSHRFDSVSSSENETGQDEVKATSSEIRVVASPYTALMKSKIQELPLPPVLKNYLNFYREF